MQLLNINTGTARPLRIEGRDYLSAIGKTPVSGPVAVGALGLAGDEQADPSVHGGLSKAIYAYPQEHLPYWQAQRREHGVSLFDELLPPGFLGENLSLSGLLEADVWVGDLLHFPDCVLRVTEPRQPCFKFNAVMGFAHASKRMAQSGHCGFYLAVKTPGTLQAGQTFSLQPGSRGMSIAQAFSGKRGKHLR
jgi:MOSC domain-containing protein YiiM